MPADEQYIADTLALAGAAAERSAEAREQAALLIADAFASGGLLHAFGTGHSHMLTLELFYRAGGFAAVDPILIGPLMLHESASSSTILERDAGLLDDVVKQASFSAGDALLVVSNSGGNALVVGLAERALSEGVPVIALTSVRHATSERSRETGVRLHEIATVVLDNLGVEGDASLEVGGVRVGPTSTVIGALLLNAVMARVAQVLTERGIDLDVFSSANLAHGDERNAALIAQYSGRVSAL